jgi:hypothetical protein
MSKQRIPQTPQSPEGYSASTPPSKPVSVVQLLIETWGPDTMRRLCEVCETFGVTRDTVAAEAVGDLRAALLSRTCGTRADRRP